jgi:hypothetical protein
MNTERSQISTMVNMDDPKCVIEEAKKIVSKISPDFDFTRLDKAFEDVVKLFRGGYPGYQECTTKYHDLQHTTDTFMAITRLVHGAVINGENFRERDINLGLVCALLHDTGYIQKTDDVSGTGGKYTLVHVSRSIGFMNKYFAENVYSRKELLDGSDILKHTRSDAKGQVMNFRSPTIALIAKMLVTADLIGQMADRTYLEKLLFLYHEFREGNVGDYESELGLLNKTLEFYEVTKERLANELGGANRFMRYHFQERWNIDRDLYEEAIDSNIEYLKMILKNHKQDYQLFLRRSEENEVESS